jgi:hypothetical protein
LLDDKTKLDVQRILFADNPWRRVAVDSAASAAGNTEDHAWHNAPHRDWDHHHRAGQLQRRIDPDGRVFIGEEAFSSEQGLAATLDHEAEVHARDQRLNGRWYTDKIGRELMDIEANDRVIADAKRLNLPADELERVQAQYKEHYDNVLHLANKMSPEAAEVYRRQMDQHIFTLAHVY